MEQINDDDDDEDHHKRKQQKYRVGQKVSKRNLHITSSNTGIFSKFLHYNILQEIYNKTVIKYPTSP